MIKSSPGGPQCGESGMRRYGVIAGIVAATLLVSSCTSNSSTTAPVTSSASVVSSVTSSPAPSSNAPISTTALSSAPASTPPVSVSQSSSKPLASSSKSSTSSATVKVSVPTTIAGSAKADTAFAVDAYRGMLAVSDEARSDPSKDWTTELRTYAGDPYAASYLASLQAQAAAGIHGSGKISVNVTVSSVAKQMIVIVGCVDTTNVKALDKSGNSVKAPNAPGSYWRFPQTVTLYKNNLKDAPKTGGWLVSEVKSNLKKTC